MNGHADLGDRIKDNDVTTVKTDHDDTFLVCNGLWSILEGNRAGIYLPFSSGPLDHFDLS